jgi:hypothetical protein
MEIGRELVKTLSLVNEQINEIQKEAAQMSIPAGKLRDEHGNYVLVPMLAAKAQLLHALTLINQKGS